MVGGRWVRGREEDRRRTTRRSSLQFHYAYWWGEDPISRESVPDYEQGVETYFHSLTRRNLLLIGGSPKTQTLEREDHRVRARITVLAGTRERSTALPIALATPLTFVQA